MNSPDIFDKDYYENGILSKKSCYENYRWLENETLKSTMSMIDFAEIKKGSKVLDYGCAKGFYVYALQLCGMESYGFDVSEYAIKNGKEEVKNNISNVLDSLPLEYDLIICKDVFEHISKDNLSILMDKLCKMSKKIMIIVPLGNGNTYYYEEDNMDITHIIKEDFLWWKGFLSMKCEVMKESYHIKNVKDKQYKNNIKSTGVFVCKTTK